MTKRQNGISSMKNKIEKELTRLELADCLEKIAGELRSGTMIEYQDHLENLKRAVENKQLEVVHHEIRDLRARMKACHRDFK
jgi:hypothetical protein